MARIVRRWRLVAALAVVAGLLLWAGWKWWEIQSYRRAMAEIDYDMGAGRHALAARKLAAILARNPRSDDAAYLLGKCEKARGRIDEASLAWARVPPGSSFAYSAIEDRIQLQIDRGQLADAEQVIVDMLKDSRFDGLDLPGAFVPIYLAQGRVEEAKRLIEVRWNRINDHGDGALEQAINLVRAYVDLRGKTTSIEATRALLDDAARLAPKDDRISLGRANLAIRTGSYEEAARWLESCRQRRPDDLAVWRARLDWAIAAGRMSDARAAMEHLPAVDFTQPHVQRLAARFAARQGNTAAERLALKGVIAADPTDFVALARLAELEVKSGHPEVAAELSRKKTDVERLQARYQKLHERYQPERDAAEMAALAEQLGSLFEARAFLTVAVAANPDRSSFRKDLARISQNFRPDDQPGRTLVDLFDAELDALGKSLPSAWHPSSGPGRIVLLIRARDLPGNQARTVALVDPPACR
jgi:enediyne biosynthesis protein E4